MFIVIMVVTWFVGVFGWAQIIGSLQNIKQRGLGMTLVTVTIWCAIMGAIAWASLYFFGSQKIALYIGYGVSFLMILFSGKIQ